MTYIATAVDFQFRTYMAKKQAMELRKRQKAAGGSTPSGHIMEIGSETQKEKPNGDKEDPLECDNCKAQPDVRNNPPRAGPEKTMRNKRLRRRRCL